MHKPESVQDNGMYKILRDHQISDRKPDPVIINKKLKEKNERTCRIVEFAIPADYSVKIKESEKSDKYLDLARELRKLLNMRVTVIPIVIGAFGTVSQDMERELKELKTGGRIETIHTTALLRSAKIPRTIPQTSGDLWYFCTPH